MPLVRNHPSAVVFVQALGDCVCVAGACVLSAHLTFPDGAEIAFREYVLQHLGYLTAFIVIWCGAATDQRLFSSRRGDTLGAQLTSILKAAAVALVLTALIVAFFKKRDFDVEFMIHFGGWTVLFLLIFRAGTRLFLWSVRRHGYNFRHILIVGANERGRHMVNVMAKHEEFGYRLMGVLDDEPERIKYFEQHGVPYLGKIDDLERVLVDEVVDEVYVCLPVRTYYEKITSMAHLCEGIGTPIRLMADLFALHMATSKVWQFEDVPLISLSTVPEAQVQLFLKRTLDVFVSGAFLVLVAWWLFPVIALAIKLESKGPVFFMQERVGLNHRRFGMVKFRSMVANAEELKEKLAAANEADGPVFKMKHDPRMTKVGRFIRKFSIDELPQFFNVFVGHMSLVGPRPPVPKEVDVYTWDQRRRLSVRPGVTGLQQVCGRSDLSFDEWIELDLAYIDSWTVMEDIRILMRTFQVVLTGKGAA